MSVYFKDADHMHEFLEDLWKHINFEKGLGDKLRDYEVSYLYTISDPEGYVYIDSDNVLVGEEAKTKGRDAILRMELSGDTIVKFWLKKLSLPVALATRKIKAKGPIPKMLKMSPALKPMFPLFPEFCRKHNLPID